MLEIRIYGATTNLPPQEMLTAYNISLSDLTADGTRHTARSSARWPTCPWCWSATSATGGRVAF